MPPGVRLLTIVLACALLLLTAAAPSQAKAPSLRIEQPKQGQIVRSTEVTVKLKLSNEPKGALIQLSLDGVAAARTAKTQVKLAGLVNGEHLLEALLLNRDGTPVAPSVQAAVTFRYDTPSRAGKIGKDTIVVMTATPRPTPTPVLIPSPTPSPFPTSTPSPIATPTPIPTPALTPTPTMRPTPVPTPTPIATPTPRPAFTPGLYFRTPRLEDPGGVLTKLGERLPVTIQLIPGNFSISPEHVVFTDNQDTVHLVSPAGAVQRARAQGLYQMGRASLSPDGARVAVQASEDPRVPPGSLNIYVVELASGQWRRISALPVNEESPRWFPRSNRIAYSSFDPDAGLDLHIYDWVQQREVQVIRGAGGISVAISPDERMLFEPSLVRLYNLASGQMTADLRPAVIAALTRAGYEMDTRYPGQANRGTAMLDATFSPDGTAIVFDSAVKRGDRYGNIIAQISTQGADFRVLQDMLPVNPAFSNLNNYSQVNPVWLAPPQTASPPSGSFSTPRPVSTKLDCRPHSFPQRTQGSLAVDPTNDQGVYIGVEQEGYFRTTDGGQTWQRITSGIKAWERLEGPGLCYEEFYETIIDPRNPNRICIAMAGGPGTLRTPSSAGNNGVYCSRDGGSTWTQMATPTMNTAVYALAADPANFDVMYAGVNGGPCSNGPPVCPAGTYFNTTGAIYKTTDGGQTWTELNALYVEDLRVVMLHVDAQNPNIVLAGTFSKLPNSQSGPGNFGGLPQLGVLRSTDGGRTWTASTSGMTSDPREQALLAMKASPRNGNRVYVTASSNRSYWSDDGGRTFHNAARMATLAFDPHDASALHMLGCNGESIMESRDGGATWTVKSRTPGFVSIERGMPTDIEWSRTNPNTVFLAGPYAMLYKSTDGGATWTQILSADRLPPQP